MKRRTLMKKTEKEFSSISGFSGDEKRGITRREFLKGTAGLVLLLGSGFNLNGITELAEPETIPIGPQLRDELTVVATTEGARVDYAGETCFTVNKEGLQLLSLADGDHTLEEIIHNSGMASNPEAVADFFLTLGEAGYLSARLEVNKIAVIQ